MNDTTKKRLQAELGTISKAGRKLLLDELETLQKRIAALEARFGETDSLSKGHRRPFIVLADPAVLH